MNKRLLTLCLFLAPLTLVSCGQGGPASSEETSSESSLPPASSSESLASSESSSHEPGLPIDGSDLPLKTPALHHYNAYQIMPYSFADGNGDKIGDLKGITAKLDYLADLHYNAIWMTPIFPSPSYHKYDATNYYDIDSQFGNLDDFDALVEKAHEKGIDVILDLAINHASSNHEWFRQSCQAHINNDTGNKYYRYFNIQEGNPDGSAWHRVPGSSNLIYEGRFYSGMPDFDLQSVLDNPNGYLANEFKDIFAFWILDHDIDGFRLDAVTSYFTSDIQSNTAFLKWINDECKDLKSDFYLVGEGSWSVDGENKTYQTSGVDAFFNFNNRGVEPSYSIPSMISKKNATYLAKNTQQSWSIANGGTPANFIANHDIGRLVGSVSARSEPRKAKLGHSLLGLLPGATYNYYGDEIGMAVPTNKAGDPDIRLHMNWGDNYVTNDPPGAVSYQQSSAYPYANVADQLKDADSILNHVRKINALRLQFPEITQGQSELLDSFKDAETGATVAAVSKKTEESQVVVVVNPSATAEVEYDFSALGAMTPVAEVSVEGASTFRDHTLYLAPGAVVVLR